MRTIERIPIETVRPNRDIMKIAHRGSTIFAPENTLPALEKAIELGFEYVEIDVYYTSDGVPVLIHDGTVDRTTNGSGKVNELTLAELQQLDAGFWFDDEFIGTPVPTLEEALKILQGEICILWDPKMPPEKAAIDLFRRYGFDRDCLLINFRNAESKLGLLKARPAILKHWPEAPLMPEVKSTEDISTLLSIYPSIRAVLIPRNKISAELVDAAHAEGLLVSSSALWQADHPRSYQRIIEVGADLFMLDYIDSFYTYMETGNIDTPPPKSPRNSGDFSY